MQPLSIITLNINEENTSIKNQGSSDGLNEQDPVPCCLREMRFKDRDTKRLKITDEKRNTTLTVAESHPYTPGPLPQDSRALVSPTPFTASASLSSVSLAFLHLLREDTEEGCGPVPGRGQLRPLYVPWGV